jgi:hypothetical protein
VSKRSGAWDQKHYERALRALAGHRCSSDLTDGFCGPNEKPCYCRRPKGGYDRDCATQAAGLLHALETVGMMVVWVYDKDLPPELSTLKERFERG